MALLGFCETNAMKAYRVSHGKIERFQWLVKLSKVLIDNPYLTKESSDDEGSNDTGIGECGNLDYCEHRGKCYSCDAWTHWRCPCGTWCCRAGSSNKLTRCPAYFAHVVDKLG